METEDWNLEHKPGIMRQVRFVLRYYRKEFVKGCSCKQAEYSPVQGPATPGKRAEAGGWSSETVRKP